MEVHVSASYRYDQMKSMGVTNGGWGVCGFTSALYAMYSQNPGARPMLINAPRPFTVLASIKTYLAMLYADSNTALLTEIEDFTRSFGIVDGTDFTKFTPRSYILYINESGSTYINATDEMDNAIFKDGKFGIGMPPDGVADYLKRVWGYGSTVQMADCVGDAIVGVKDTTADNTSKLYGGLCHWVYRRGTQIFSWGDSFVDLKDANPTFQVCCTVKILK
jgi:hypothetical protein